jgi:hypothetical protein
MGTTLGLGRLLFGLLPSPANISWIAVRYEMNGRMDRLT